MLIHLSYPLSTSSPLYYGLPNLKLSSLKSQDSGDSANLSAAFFCLHSGTHIDAPYHFCPNGNTVAQMLRKENRFEKTYCINLIVEKGSCITIDDINDAAAKVSDANALLIHTGFCHVRETNPAHYLTDYPWIHPDVPEFLKEKIPDLNLFGIDTISISRPDHRQMGHSCHKSFLCGKKSVLLLEDLDLREFGFFYKKFDLLIYPWIIADLDGVPVTAFAELPDT